MGEPDTVTLFVRVDRALWEQAWRLPYKTRVELVEAALRALLDAQPRVDGLTHQEQQELYRDMALLRARRANG